MEAVTVDGQIRRFDGTAEPLHIALERYDEASKRSAATSKRFVGPSERSTGKVSIPRQSRGL